MPIVWLRLAPRALRCSGRATRDQDAWRVTGRAGKSSGSGRGDRSQPLTERKRDLNRICRQSHTPILGQVETFPDGEALFGHCNEFGFEGVVSKRRASGYSSGPSRHWVKVKCPDWKRINVQRHKLFEGPRKPELVRHALVDDIGRITGCASTGSNGARRHKLFVDPRCSSRIGPTGGAHRQSQRCTGGADIC